jgi:hypothetical protein
MKGNGLGLPARYFCHDRKQTMHSLARIGFGLVTLASLIACEKEITVDLPAAEPQIVVEGTIEVGRPPFVMLSWTQGYFAATDLNSILANNISGATVVVSNGMVSDTLIEICSSQIPVEFLPMITDLTGLSPELLQQFDVCAYTSFNTAIFGEENRTYSLTVKAEGKTLTARTKIPTIVPLDEVYFKVSGNSDSLGFAYGLLTDPDTLGNCYRWYAKRINKYPAWSKHAGQPKDGTYIAPIGSAYDDRFFNGLTFEFAYYRGSLIGSQKEDDINAERAFFKVGDTIAVRGCVIDRGVYDFVTSMEDQVSSAGSPFATPVNLKTNIKGGLGIWAGYGAVYDTIICTR